jgi:hypothetical protein
MYKSGLVCDYIQSSTDCLQTQTVATQKMADWTNLKRLMEHISHLQSAVRLTGYPDNQCYNGRRQRSRMSAYFLGVLQNVIT